MHANLRQDAPPLLKSKSPRRRLSESIIVGLVAAIDILLVVICGLSVFFFYVAHEPDATSRYTAAAIITAFLLAQAFYMADMYRFNAIITPSQQIGKLISITSLVFLLLVVVAFAIKISDDFSRFWLFSTAVLTIAVICLGRVGFLAIIRQLAKNGYLVNTLLLYGATEQAERFIAHLRQMNAPWNRVVAIFDDRLPTGDSEIAGVPIAGGLEELIQVARESRADEIVVALPWGDQTRISQIFHRLRVLPTNIRLSPDLAALGILSRNLNYLYGVPLASIYDKPLSGWHAVEKRVIDGFISGSLLVVLAPLLLLIMAAIKLDSPGPIFFRQRRYGFNDELIRIWKFRTMYVEQQDPDAEKLTTPNDPRVTRFGSFLRRTSLDELPQLFNVFTGDMSLVGPRPHATQAKAGGDLYQDAVGEYSARHRVKPGITGWAQVNGWRGETDTHEKIVKRVEHDLYYIDNWSIWLDLRILLKTFGVLFSQENAY